jgi:ABC-type sugar transport system ATPase subunit
MTVQYTIAFGLKMACETKAEIDRKGRRAAEMLQLMPLPDRLPKQLSGGQRQRAAIGRAITRDPKLFRSDEPLPNVDAALRMATRIEIAGLKARMADATIIHVTHDQVVAMTFANRIVVLNAGRIEQVGTPLEQYHTPANRLVAGFIGSPAMNFVPLEGGMVASGDTVATANAAAMTLGVRPKDLLRASGQALLRGTVSIIENLGELVMACVDIGGTEPLIVKLPGTCVVKAGDAVALSADAARPHPFDAEGQAIRAWASPQRRSAPRAG